MFSKLAYLALASMALTPLSGCNSSELSDPGTAAALPSTSTEIVASAGGSANSHDEAFAISFAPGVFSRDVTVEVIEGVRSAAAAVTIGKLYEIEVSPSNAIAAGFEARLTFDASSVPTSMNIGDLVVASGNVVGELPTDLLPLSHNAVTGELSAITTHLSWFGLMHEDGFVACTCNATETCDEGCEFCDEDCAASGGAGEYPYPTCISNNGCESDERCLDGWCAGVCSDSGDCATGLECRDGWCVASCSSDTQCTGNFKGDCCFQGICVVAEYCGVQGPGESCSTFFDKGDGCDCGCGGIDPDCNPGGCSFPGCADAACDHCWNIDGESTTCVEAP